MVNDYAYGGTAQFSQYGSKLDGTCKYLFRLSDGNVIESVLMRYKHGNSVCISSQVGCRMGCRFCVSTIGGVVRSSKPSEMLDQIYRIQKDSGERVSNVVVMGTGEPTFKNEQESKDYLLFGKRPDQEEGKQEAPKDSYPAGPTITLKNLNMTGESGASWIRALQGTLEGLRFENITWNNSGGGSYIGLIGRSTGTVNYVDFDRITSMPIRQVIMWAVSPTIREIWNMSVQRISRFPTIRIPVLIMWAVW